MKSKARKYTLRLHPGDPEHAACIVKLDKILVGMKNGGIRKGTLTSVLAKAVYSYFDKNGKDARGIVSTEPGGKQAPRDGECTKEYLVTNVAETTDDSECSTSSDNIRRSLMQLI